MLRVARRIAALRPVRIRTSYLAAHAIPKGTEADVYLESVCMPGMELGHAEGLIDAVDGFCEGSRFRHPRSNRCSTGRVALACPSSSTPNS